MHGCSSAIVLMLLLLLNLDELQDFVMGQGLIPADGEVWRVRRRAILPSLHKKYLTSMVNMFGDCALHGCPTLDKVCVFVSVFEL